jgi:hypothetical protein
VLFNRSLLSVSTDGTATVTSQCDKTVKSFSVGSNVQRMRIDPLDCNRFAVGGDELDLRIFNVETQQQLYQAKNVSCLFVFVSVRVFAIESSKKREAVWGGFGQLVSSVACLRCPRRA